MPQAVAKARPQPPSGTIKVGYISDSRVYDKDSLPEWSKGVDSSSTSASCVGSNPTAVIYFVLFWLQANWIRILGNRMGRK